MRCIVHYPNQSTYSKSKPLSETYKCPTYLLADRSYLIAYDTHDGSISRKMSKLSDTKCKINMERSRKWKQQPTHGSPENDFKARLCAWDYFIPFYFTLTGYWLFVILYGEIQSPRLIVPVEACETGALTEGFVFPPCRFTNSQYPVYYLAWNLLSRLKRCIAP